MAESGFVINDDVYPFPTAFRLCDPVLVTKLTGMSWIEFVDALDDGGAGDPVVMAGMVGVAVWQQNPRWTRDKVVRFVESLDMEALGVNGEEEDDAVPPHPAASPSAGSVEGSSREPGSRSETTSTPPSTGTSTSDTSSPVSLQAA